MSNVMGAMEQCARSAVGAQDRQHRPEQGHRGRSMGLRSERRVFRLDKSEEVSRWSKQSVQTEQRESLGMITGHESLSLQEPNEAEEGGRAWITKESSVHARRDKKQQGLWSPTS